MGGLPNPLLDADPYPPGCRPALGADPPPPMMQTPLDAAQLSLDADPSPPLEADAPWMQTPFGCRPTGCRSPPPWMRSSLDADPPDSDPWMQTPPVNRMAHRCKNITVPQTSFAGCKNGLQSCCTGST